MKIKKSDSWWDTALYIGVFILVLLFLYEFLKLWNAGATKASQAGQALADAFTNTIATVESAFENLLTDPLSLVTSFFGGLPNLISLGISFFSTLVGSVIGGGFLSTLSSIFGSIFGSPAPTVAAAGSSFTTTTPDATGNPVSGAPGTTFSYPASQ